MPNPTAQELAQKAIDDWVENHTGKHFMEDFFVPAIRAAERAAYERAAVVIEKLYQRGNRGHANFVAAAIRKLADG